MVDGLPVGNVGLHNIDWRHRRCEFGKFFISEAEYPDRGIGKKALKLALDYAFCYLHMHKVYLYVLSDNERACRLYASAGTSAIVGEFIPTGKNAPAKDFLPSHGFRRQMGDSSNTRWVLEVSLGIVPIQKWIQVEEA